MRQQHIPKPDWLKIRIGSTERFGETQETIASRGLHTICQSGRCPNKGECWAKGTATFMIGGDICTRSCKFCNTKTGRPMPLADSEPDKVADSVKTMGLKHAVVTSVDRDDLPDLGAAHWVRTINRIKEVNPGVTTEVLIPDFQGRTELVDMIVQAGPTIISHNMETVRRLTPKVRSAAKYDISLSVLKHIAGHSDIPVKSGIMLGLGETPEEIEETIQDMYNNGCSLLSIGQYLQPSRKHLPVSEYVAPATFAVYKEIAQKMGYRYVMSGPLVRTSYGSVDFLNK